MEEVVHRYLVNVVDSCNCMCALSSIELQYSSKH